jgi:hypothetical protein
LVAAIRRTSTWRTSGEPTRWISRFWITRKQFGLHGERSFSHFVQKNGAAVRVFEQSGARIGRSGKRAAHVAEELAFEEGIDHRGAVADREPLLRDGAHLVNRFGDQFLAHARRPNQQNVGVVPRHLADHFEHFHHGRAAAHDPVKLQVGQKLLLQAADAFPLVERLGKFVQGLL